MKRTKQMEMDLVELNMRCFNRVCRMLKLSVRVENYTAFVTYSTGDRVVMPLEKLMGICRTYINRVVSFPILYTHEEVVLATSIKQIFDIPL